MSVRLRSRTISRAAWGGSLTVLSLLGAAGCVAADAGDEAVGETSQGLTVYASYDATLRAPKCGGAASACDTGSLVNGRASIGPEPNASNTINGSCADGIYGSYHGDESLDKVRVETVDGSDLAPGKTVRISATVWAYYSYTSDKLDLYYTSAVSPGVTPTWTLLTTLTPTKAGAQTLTATYTLPAGGPLQAVRAQFRYGGSASPCTMGSYNDRDDLVFSVAPPAPDTTPPATSITSPASGAVVSGAVTVSAGAADNIGVTKVEFFRGSDLVATRTASPYSYSWDTTAGADGAYTLSTKAYDAAGNVATSSPVAVTVANANGITALQSVAGHSPAASVVLSSGRVLVVGNSSGYPWTSPTEEFDPAATSFLAAGSMNVPRSGERLVLLSDGRALVTGGWGNTSSPRSVASAEIYTPATAAWTSVASMTEGRYQHTATVLADGRVLVAGGSPDPSASPTNKVEIYDPQADAWTLTTPMPVGLTRHSAALLSNGSVLVIGGSFQVSGGYQMNQTPYLYDPTTQAWSQLGASVSGEIAARLPNGDLLIADAYNTKIFREATSTFSTIPSALPKPAGWTCFDTSFATASDGNVYAIGCGPALNKFDVATSTWSTVKTLPVAHTAGALQALPGNKLLAVGGKSFTCTSSGGGTSCNEGAIIRESQLVELPLPNGILALPSVAGHSPAASVMLSSGRVLIVGNSTGYPWTSPTEEYNAAATSFVAAGSMNVPRTNEKLVLLSDGRALVTGGSGNTSSPRSLASAEVYTPATAAWTGVASMNERRYEHTATVLADGRVLVAGGSPDPSAWPTNTVEIYDPQTDAWTLTTPMPVGLTRHSAALLSNGSVLVIGGSFQVPGGYQANQTPYLYNPTTQAWSQLSASVLGKISVRLPNGDLLIARSGSTQIFRQATSTFSTIASTVTVPAGWTCGDMAFTAASDGNVYAIGCGPALSKFDVATSTWSTVRTLPLARVAGALQALPGNKLLAAGGTSMTCTPTSGGMTCNPGPRTQESHLVELP